MKINKKFIVIAIVLIFIISFMGSKGELVENMEIPIGVGEDIEKINGNIIYKIPILIYSFEESNKITSYELVGEGLNPTDTRQNRQLKASKKFIFGLNKAFIFSEEAAKNGIDVFLDLSLNNPEINDRAICIVCKGRAETLLNYKVKGYDSSSDYIDGMVKNLNQFNFFPMQYSLTDLMVRCDAEGRTATLPYIEIKNGALETTGLAIFNKDKMVGKATMEETKIINILKENNVKGILSIQDNSNHYISLYGTSKRKVKCYKKDGKYKFDINLNIEGQIISNKLYKNINLDKLQMDKFQADLARKVETNCSTIIKNIMLQYKVDVLDLGRIAAAKYGRHTGVDWNKAITSDNIKISAKIKVYNEGRGNY